MTAPTKTKQKRTLDNACEWLPEKLKQWRKKKKLTQDEGAAHLNVTLGTYRNWEQGRKPPSDELKLSALLARLKEPVSTNGNRSPTRTSTATARS